MVKVNVERTVKVVIYRIHSQYDGVYWTCIDLKLAPLFPFFLYGRLTILVKSLL